MEPTQCSASVLEALMGFDELQSEHRAPGRSRVLSERYLQRVASIGGTQKKKSPSRCQPFRMTIEEPPEVFSIRNVLWDREHFSIHNFMNEKHFSTDEIIPMSKDFHDLPEVVDSMDISPRHTRTKDNTFNHVENGPNVSKPHNNAHRKDEDKRSCFISVESYKGGESREKVIEEQRKNGNLMLSKQGRNMNEMFILPHYATFPSDLNCKPVEYDFPKRVCLNKDHLHSGSPLCLSCKDRRFDRLGKKSHRSGLNSAYTVIARSRIRSRYEALRNTWFLKPEGLGTWLQYKPLNTRSNKKNASEPSSKLSSKKLRIFPCPDSVSDHVDNDGCIVGNDLKTRVEKNGLCDQHSVNSLSSNSNLAIEQPSLSSIVPETDGHSSTNSCRATCTSIQQDGLSFDRYDSKELDSIVRLEEFYQPSPVSVLERHFKEETFSSSESSGINGRELELLMWDTPGTNSDEHELFVSSEEDGGEGSICNSDEIYDIMSTFKFKDSRDFSYLVDVISEAGLHRRNLEKGYVLWHDQERHVISPSVFEALEKKFGEQVSWRRSERKLLFDRINSGLAELFRSFVGVPEWAKPVSRRFWPLLDQEMVEDEVWTLLDSQEKEGNKDLVDKQFGKEIGWIDLGDEIGSICRELEGLLIIELVAEVGSSII
ncbi:uncharacterized protein LOC111810944 [Cucurbita pepo subsp. pepo]|uniref:uncharacterized protein LOC111810944 n=1 Tax=Cucurbita pepo subsp. pepo TaxID=3664 RepID=UPI000C9DA0BE|nr:uncharacterized protein LOC111810944 [Cucurbita pepo subsp. pepo]